MASQAMFLSQPVIQEVGIEHRDAALSDEQEPRMISG